MLGRISKSALFLVVSVAIVVTLGSARADWLETFDGAQPVFVWTFGSYPALTGTFTQTIKTEPGGNKYLSMDETTAFNTGAGSFGSAFGIGFGSDEDFTDMRVGAVINVVGDVSGNYCGLGARASYVVDPDGSLSGAPGILANAYAMLIHLQNGPANLKIEILKVVNNQESVIMKTYHEEPVPGIGHNHSYYAELDVVGSNPAYITASLYQYKGGPLVAMTPTLIDTNGNDPWEDAGVHDAVFSSGKGAVFATNQDPTHPGYHVTFDSVSSSVGAAAVNPSPADGDVGVPVSTVLDWIEAQFATSCELWFGVEGTMQKVSPGPAGSAFDPGILEFGRTYQWRVDQVGPGGVVQGRSWTFTTCDCQMVEDFESYLGNLDIQSMWPHNISGDWKYVFLGIDADKVHSGVNAMTYEYQNQAEPFFTVATRTLARTQNWTGPFKALSLTFRGEHENHEQPLYVELEDTLGHKGKVEHPYLHACQSETWIEWSIDTQQFTDAGVNLEAVYKISIGTGSGVNSGQGGDDRDYLYIDDIRLCPARCFNLGNLNLRGDINGDCVVDFRDFVLICGGWLNEGLSPAP